MTTPGKTPEEMYQEMIDEIIRLIKDDDTADSQTIDALVARLQELNALATAQFFSRVIATGNGLTGGGDLSADRTISLSEGAVESLSKADNSVSGAALDTRLQSYLTTAKAATDYATKSEAKQVYVVPFTYGGTVNGETVSPQIRLPKASVLTNISASVDTEGSSVTVATTGGVSASVSISAGQTSVVSPDMSSTVSGPLRVRITSSSATGVTVLLRFREV